jgi:hypothetical protein
MIDMHQAGLLAPPRRVVRHAFPIDLSTSGLFKSYSCGAALEFNEIPFSPPPHELTSFMKLAAPDAIEMNLECKYTEEVIELR